MDRINSQIAERLRRLRKAANLSLEALSDRSGVSRATLSQIESVKTNPTIAVLWKVSQGLDISFAELLGGESTPAVKLSRRADARYLYSADRRFRSRPLLANVPGHRVELYELQLEPATVEDAEPHPPGTWEQLIATEGAVSVGVSGEEHELKVGDALFFQADQPHRYACLGEGPFVGLCLILYAD